MKPAEITDVVERARTLLAERYVFADVGARLADLLRERLAGGRYRGADDPEALAALVTEDLRSVNGDLHLGLRFHPEVLPEAADDSLAGELARTARTTMAGIARVERLDGNVGLLEIEPALLPPSVSADALLAALRVLVQTDALILDLRRTIGGDPETEVLVFGHFFDRPTQLYTMYERDGEGRQFWSPAYLPGPRFDGHRPLFVLTSATTFSGGESLAYALQQQGRATVVGERTGGGAHPRIGVRVHPHLRLAVPVARPVNPVTGTNWEGRGVVPDVEVPAADALAVAHRAALRRPAPGTPTPGSRPTPVATAR